MKKKLLPRLRGTAKSLLYSTTGVLIFAAIILMVNLISSFVYLRLDFSTGRIYSLSKSSKKILRSLPDRILIKAFFTKDLPQEFSANGIYAEDMLSEYKTYSRGKVSYSFIDPLVKKGAARDAHLAGIPAVRFTQIRRDKYEVKEAYMGLLFIYGDRKEIIPVVRSGEGLEYDITSRIKKLLSPELKTICISVGQGETTNFGEVSAAVNERYKTEFMDLSHSTYVSEGASSLLVVGPKQKFSEKALLMVDQFIMKGVPVALLLDEYNTNMQAFYAAKFDNGFRDFLEFYGVKILPGMVLDAQCEQISVRQSQGLFAIENVVPYPFFPLITDLNRSSAITRALESVGLIFVSPLELKKKDGFTYEVIMRSSRKSWLAKNPRSLYPFQRFEPAPADKKGPFDLAVIITPSGAGKKTKYGSLFADRTGREYKNILRESAKPCRIFVIGNSGFAVREPAFFLNLLDWLSQDEDLISIRSKESSYRPLRPASDAARAIVKYAAIFLVPVAVIAYGVFRWNARKKIKQGLRSLYA